MQVMVIDIGGNHVKLLVAGQHIMGEFASGSSMTANEMVCGVLRLLMAGNTRLYRLAILVWFSVVSRFRNRATSGLGGSDSTLKPHWHVL